MKRGRTMRITKRAMISMGAGVVFAVAGGLTAVMDPPRPSSGGRLFPEAATPKGQPPAPPARPSGSPAPNPAPHATPSTPQGFTAPATPPAPSREQAPSTAGPATAAEALATLAEGNERWVSGSPRNPRTEPTRRAETASAGQHPFVTILTCADSRLPVERIFDQGVGDVFVVRVAGNVVGEHATGTIEYGVAHLHTPLVVVMGHTGCGAVKAACAGGEADGSVATLVREITPAVERARVMNPDLADAALLDAAVRENVWQGIFQLLRQSPTLVDAVQRGEIKIVGAVCDLSTGRVRFLGEHPWQGPLVQALSPGVSRAHAGDH